jgi:HlyD family secretion protein
MIMFQQIGKALVLYAVISHSLSLAFAQPSETRPPAVSVIRAQKVVLAEKVFAPGSVVAREDIVISPEIEGMRLVELLVNEGENVAQGQVLARLSRDVLETQMAQNEAALKRATASETEANAALARSRSLTRTGAGSEATLEQRILASQVARAQVEEAQARKRELDWRLSRTEIRAPVAGVIARRNARIGQIASGLGEAMFRLVARGELDLDAEVTEQSFARLNLGQEAFITLADGTDLKGKVRLIGGQIDANARTGRVKIALDPGSPARVGNFGQAQIVTERSETVAVPLSALLFARGEVSAQIVENGRILTRKVRTSLTESGMIGIMDGIREGESVVLRAGSFLREGDQVRPLDAKGSG